MPHAATVPVLTIALTTRALFHMEDSHALFEREGIEAFADYQRKHEDDVLHPGIAFPLARKLLALNDGAPPAAPRVEVILLSRNSSDTGLRVFNSIQHHGLDIRRATFTSGAPVWPYIKPFGAQLFLSANPESVRAALEAGVAAAAILPAQAGEPRHPQLRIPGDFLRRHPPADSIRRNQSFLQPGAAELVFHQSHNHVGPLAKACKNEGAVRIQVLQVMLESLFHILVSQRKVGNRRSGIHSIYIQCRLPIVWRIEICLGIVNPFFHVDGAQKAASRFGVSERQIKLRSIAEKRSRSDKKNIHGLRWSRRVPMAGPVALVAIIDSGGVSRAQGKQNQ